MGVEGGDRVKPSEKSRACEGSFSAPLRFTLDSRTLVTLLRFPVSLVVVGFFFSPFLVGGVGLSLYDGSS